MTEHFLHVEPLLSLYLYHIFKEVLELLHQRVLLQLQFAERGLMDRPEFPRTSRTQQAVDLILRQRELKGEPPQDHSEEYHTQRKDISAPRVIVFGAVDANRMNLRGHIPPPGSLEAVGE